MSPQVNFVIPDARSAIRNPGADEAPFDPLGSGFSLREPRSDERVGP
jgi:hypothetical protein